jgi:hypothetical protein
VSAILLRFGSAGQQSDEEWPQKAQKAQKDFLVPFVPFVPFVASPLWRYPVSKQASEKP